MIIRSELLSDIDAINEVTEAAFENHPYSQQTETFIIRDLRADSALTLSLVSEVDGRVVGHIAFSPVTVSDGTTDWYGLGPVSVLPEFQGQRIGTALVQHGLARLRALGGTGCALVGDPTFYHRFGFRNYPQLILEGIPQEVFVSQALSGNVPSGTVEFHQAFKQLSLIEKEAVSDAIIDFELAGIKMDLSDPAVQSLIEKKILTEMPDGRVLLQPSALAPYDTYFARVSQFRATEMSRVHKNPFMAAITRRN